MIPVGCEAEAMAIFMGENTGIGLRREPGACSNSESIGINLRIGSRLRRKGMNENRKKVLI